MMGGSESQWWGWEKSQALFYGLLHYDMITFGNPSPYGHTIPNTAFKHNAVGWGYFQEKSHAFAVPWSIIHNSFTLIFALAPRPRRIKQRTAGCHLTAVNYKWYLKLVTSNWLFICIRHHWSSLILKLCYLPAISYWFFLIIVPNRWRKICSLKFSTPWNMNNKFAFNLFP